MRMDRTSKIAQTSLYPNMFLQCGADMSTNRKQGPWFMPRILLLKMDRNGGHGGACLSSQRSGGGGMGTGMQLRTIRAHRQTLWQTNPLGLVISEGPSQNTTYKEG